jgi:hypothetical protein
MLVNFARANIRWRTQIDAAAKPESNGVCACSEECPAARELPSQKQIQQDNDEYGYAK